MTIAVDPVEHAPSSTSPPRRAASGRPSTPAPPGRRSSTRRARTRSAGSRSTRSNPNVVWVGTGENNSQRSVGYGDGVYKSDDGGTLWTNVGLKNSEHIGRIVIDPKDSDTVYVAAQGPLWAPGGDRGLYKTTDGGKTWTQVLKISENTGVTDVVIDPRNPDVSSPPPTSAGATSAR